jgi:dihydrofolate reductase
MRGLFLRDYQPSTVIRVNAIESVRHLKKQPAKTIVTDGSSQLVHAVLAHDLVDELNLFLYPVMLGSGKRVFDDGVRATFALTSTTPCTSGVVGLRYTRPARQDGATLLNGARVASIREVRLRASERPHANGPLQ